MEYCYILFVLLVVAFLSGQAKKIGIGDRCYSYNANSCAKYAECLESEEDESSCRCINGYVGEQGETTCLPTPVKIGDQCHLGSSTQCAAITDTKCLPDPTDSEKGTCQCSSGFVSGPNDTTCQLGMLVGEMCNTHWECVGTKTMCRSHCVCLSNNMVPSWNRQDCLEIKNKIGEECAESHQCYAGALGKESECLQSPVSNKSVCTCNSASVTDEQNSTCFRKGTLLGDKCVLQSQCYTTISYSWCNFAGECRCVEGTVPATNQKECLGLIKYDDECTDDNQCTSVENLTCNLVPNNENIRICGCRSNYMYMNESCHELAAQVGDSCEMHSDQCASLNNTSCQNGTCFCDQENYVASENNTLCLPKVGTLHLTCQEDIQCQVNYSTCQMDNNMGKRTCQCHPVIFKEYNGDCVPLLFLNFRPKLNETCVASSQCQMELGKHTECTKEGLCKCVTPSVESSGKCVVPVELHQNCTSNDECWLGSNQFSVCKKTATVSTCECGKYTVESENKCWEKLVLGENCTEDRECKLGVTGPVVCGRKNKKCTCLDPYQGGPTGNTCVSSIASQFLAYNTFVLVASFVIMANF